MLGAIAGDIIGSVHEFAAFKSTEFPLFVDESEYTDDSVLTVAVADCLLTGASYVDKFSQVCECLSGARLWCTLFVVGDSRR